MRAQCPDCRTVFRITLSQLSAANGLVRCGQCGEVFHVQSLHAAPLESAETTLIEISTETLTDTPASLPAFNPESILHSEPAASRSRLWPWGSALLTLILITQGIYWQRASLANVSALQPLMQHICPWAGCEPQVARQLDQIQLLERNVYSHPKETDALIISATFVNNASISQPFPTLAISMANVRGQTIVSRNFSPAEYLPASQQHSDMTPGAPVNIALAVIDPGSDIMTFEIDFK